PVKHNVHLYVRDGLLTCFLFEVLRRGVKILVFFQKVWGLEVWAQVQC
ncbi:MAG: hypothetical protein ACJA0J_001925, partial [Bdellovibrionota bacterium]